MLKLEHAAATLLIASYLAAAPTSTAFAQEVEKGEEEEEKQEEEGPALPEGMTLDEVLDRAEKTPPEDYPDPVPDDQFRAFLLVDQLEYRYDLEDEPDQVGTEIQGYVGGDYNRLWLKSEGETSWQGDAGFEGESENDLLYGRLFSPFWNAQVGAQYANEWTEDNHEDFWAGALALQGLAPGMFELDASLYVTENLNVLADLEAEYDVRITQRLVFQPRTELSFSAQDVPERGIGVGLTKAVVDLRLRYEFLRELAPYVGARYQTLTFETADLAEAEGEDTSRFFVLGGVRFAVY
jgi:copper resistance protein B